MRWPAAWDRSSRAAGPGRAPPGGRLVCRGLRLERRHWGEAVNGMIEKVGRYPIRIPLTPSCARRYRPRRDHA
jgi:hypothetical protein